MRRVDNYIMVRLSTKLKKEIQKEATRKGLTMTKYLLNGVILQAPHLAEKVWKDKA